jgi:cell division protein FtsL
MNGDTFEYAIKKDVRNNPIIREVDVARHREMWRSLAIGVFLVAVLLFSAWQHFELLRHGYQLEDLQKALAAEDDTTSHLRLEIEAFRSPERIQAIATRRLHMKEPGPDDAVVVERTVAPAVPPTSVVASR